MNLYLLKQNERDGLDTYDSMVVAAETEEEARLIHPEGDWGDAWADCWAFTPDKVTVERIGTAKLGTEKGIVLNSFNAG